MEENSKVDCLIDDVYSIVIELSENDPLFVQKKELLDHKGFGVKETVQVEGSLSLESLSSVLEKLLQFARIVNLDKVELYFGEDACSSVGVYSFRNELGALNWILSLIDSSSSACKTRNQKHAMKILQEAVISRINELRLKPEEGKVDKNYNCDKENCLVQWGETNGVKTGLQIAQIEGFGRGAIATEDLNVGDVAIEIPISIIISEDYVYKSDMPQVLEKIDGISSETMLLFWSMKEKHNTNSKFKAYFNSLPESFNTGLSFGVEAIMALDGTLLLDEIMQAKELLREKYEELLPMLSKHPEIFPPEMYTWEEYLWACELWYSNSMQVKFPDGKLKTCLIPIAGFLNHSIHPHITKYGAVDVSTNSLKFPLSRPCLKGEQCYLSYGNYSTSHLITFYGFSPHGINSYDVIPLDIDIDETDQENPESCWTSHMLRGTWLSNNHSIFHYGLPSPLLNHLRKAHGLNQCSEIILWQNLEIEMEVLETLRSTFQDMMQNLGDSESDFTDGENARWDVKLAMGFKDLQRKIVSSIMESCSNGQTLIQHELSKRGH